VVRWPTVGTDFDSVRWTVTFTEKEVTFSTMSYHVYEMHPCMCACVHVCTRESVLLASLHLLFSSGSQDGHFWGTRQVP
jgi:hypothetical protein